MDIKSLLTKDVTSINVMYDENLIEVLQNNSVYSIETENGIIAICDKQSLQNILRDIKEFSITRNFAKRVREDLKRIGENLITYIVTV